MEAQEEGVHVDHPIPTMINITKVEQEKFEKIQQEVQQIKAILHELISPTKGDRRESMEGQTHDQPTTQGEKK